MKKRLVCTGIVALLATMPAWAALGGAPSFHGVPSTPSSALRVMLASGKAAAPWSINTTTQDGDTVIREYLDSSGKVFAVSWRGPRIASIDTLLGSYFPAWEKGLAAAHAARGGGYGPVVLREPELVVETGGHMGSLLGRAWLPKALPQGFTTDLIQ